MLVYSLEHQIRLLNSVVKFCPPWWLYQGGTFLHWPYDAMAGLIHPHHGAHMTRNWGQTWLYGHHFWRISMASLSGEQTFVGSRATDMFRGRWVIWLWHHIWGQLVHTIWSNQIWTKEDMRVQLSNALDVQCRKSSLVFLLNFETRLSCVVCSVVCKINGICKKTELFLGLIGCSHMSRLPGEFSPWDSPSPL